MIKFIILCSVIALCMARSLNDNVPVALINIDDVAAESDVSELKSVDVAPKDIVPNEAAPIDAVPEKVASQDSATKDITPEEGSSLSDLAAEIDSNSEDVVNSDKIRFFPRFPFTTAAATPTTTPLPMMQAINLLLTLNSMAMAG